MRYITSLIILWGFLVAMIAAPAAAIADWGRTITTPAGDVTVNSPAMLVASGKAKVVKVWSPRGKENKVLAELPSGSVVVVLGLPAPDEAGKVPIITADGVEGWVSLGDLSPVIYRINNGKKGTLAIPGPAFIDGRDLDAKESVETVNVWTEKNKKTCEVRHGVEIQMLEPPAELGGRMKILVGVCTGYINVGFLNEKKPPNL